MACVQSFMAGPVLVDAVAAGNTVVWIGGPRPAAGLNIVEGTLRPTSVVGNAQVRLAVAFYATHLEGSPSFWQPIGAATSSDLYVSASVKTQAEQHAFYRLALLGSLSSGAAPATLVATVSGQTTQCGGVVGARQLDVVPSPSSQPRIVPIGAPFSPRERQYWQAVVRVLGKSGGNLSVQLVSRSFDLSSRLPSAWSTLGSAVDVTSVNDELHIDAVDCGVDPSTKALTQAGLQLTPSTNAVNATVQVLVQGGN